MMGPVLVLCDSPLQAHLGKEGPTTAKGTLRFIKNFLKIGNLGKEKSMPLQPRSLQRRRGHAIYIVTQDPGLLKDRGEHFLPNGTVLRIMQPCETYGGGRADLIAVDDVTMRTEAEERCYRDWFHEGLRCWLTVTGRLLAKRTPRRRRR